MKRIVLMCALLACLALAGAACSSKSRTAMTDANMNVAASPGADAAPLEDPEQENAGTNSPQARAAFERGKELSLRDQDEEAVEAFKQAVNIDPDYAEAYFRMAYSYTALGKKDEAADAFEKAAKAYEKYVRGHAKDARAHFNMGLAY